jgi:hypothetical protein
VVVGAGLAHWPLLVLVDLVVAALAILPEMLIQVAVVAVVMEIRVTVLLAVQAS